MIMSLQILRTKHSPGIPSLNTIRIMHVFYKEFKYQIHLKSWQSTVSSSMAITVILFSLIYANQRVSVNCSNKTFVSAAKLIIRLLMIVCFHDSWMGLWLTHIKLKFALQNRKSQRPNESSVIFLNNFSFKECWIVTFSSKGAAICRSRHQRAQPSNVTIYCGLSLGFRSHLNGDLYSLIDLNFWGFSDFF